MKWCAGDEIKKAAVKDQDVLNAGDWDLDRVRGGYGACAMIFSERCGTATRRPSIAWFFC